MLVISEELVLQFEQDGGGEWPIVLWENVATIENVSATSEDADFPATNLANPSTSPLQGWRSTSTALQYVYIDLAGVANAEDINAMGGVRHNFGSAQVGVTVEGLDANDGTTWLELVEEFIPPNDNTFLTRFTNPGILELRFKLNPNLSIAPRMASIGAGPLLEFIGNGVQAGAVLLPFGRERNIVTGRTRSGDFLGRIVRGGTRRGRAAFQHIDPDWFREHADRFLEASAGHAFYWCPDPAGRPQEVNYSWLTSDPKPPTQKGGYFDLTLELEGIL